MSDSSKPAVLIVPGSFSPKSMYANVELEVRKLGLEVSTHDLPTAITKAPQPAATLADDAAYFNKVIGDFCATGRDLIVLGHSYGGIVVTESVKGFTAKKDGRGRVVGLIYVTALIPRVGDSLMALSKNGGAPEFDFLSIEGNYMSMDIEGAAKVNFSDLPMDEAIEQAKQFSTHSALSFGNEATYAGYEDVDKLAYILCTKDQVLPPFFQRKMIENLTTGGDKDLTVRELASGHCVNGTKPRELAQQIAQVLQDWKFL